MINTSHCTMAEHLLLYMIDKHHNRKSAEFELVNFLCCLKYYSDRKWQRAQSYARLVGLIDDEPAQSVKRSSDASPPLKPDREKVSDYYRYDLY